MGKKKILIAYAKAGAGHIKAAHAIENALKEIGGIEVKAIDTLDYSTKFMKKGYPAAYLFMINKIPAIWGLCYYFFDIRIVYRLFIAPVRRLNNFLGCRELVNFLNKHNPDIVINTHFLGSEIMAEMKRRGMLKKTKLISVVTDFFLHSFWVDQAVDYYCVAQGASKGHLTQRGISADRIKVFGIPVDKVFAIKKGRNKLCAKLGIQSNCRTVLIASGGFGVGPINELVKELSAIKQCKQLLVVCGKNNKLYGEIRELTDSLDEISIKVYGFVNNMDELMEVSDIIVTKSGGMTSSEAMAKELPMVITSAIPGQEARNCKYLVKSGAAIYAGDLKNANEAITGLLTSESKVRHIKENINRIKRPNSASDIAQFAHGLLRR